MGAPSLRTHALASLRDIWGGGIKPKEALERAPADISGRDRAFLMELVYGVVRYRDTLDFILKDFLKNPGRLGMDTLNNMRAASYQIFFMRVPGHASVHEAVEIEKKAPGGRPELVNAVLRNIIRKSDGIKKKLREMKEAVSGPSSDASLNTENISIVASHPKWLVRRWVRRFGAKEALKLAEAGNRVPPLTLRVNTLRIDREGLIGKLKAIGIEAEPTAYSPQGIRLKGPHSFKELSPVGSLLSVQDEAAQLISYILDPRPGERILDACAAPGGKTTHIAELMHDKGEITAVDIDGKRMERLGENISRLGLTSIKAIKADVTEIKADAKFDRILLDAPCSATGVIRRNPDIKYRHRAKDIRGFGERQLKMLKYVSAHLKPGGTIVYSTCSMEPEEGEDVVNGFLKSSEDFYIICSDMPFIKELYENCFMRTYPHRHDMDGFFSAKILRRL